MKFKNLFNIFKQSVKAKVPDIKVKRVKKIYDKDGVLKEETIESNAYIDGDKLDLYLKKMDEVFTKIDQAFKEL